MKFTEAKLEQAFIELLGNEGFPHCGGFQESCRLKLKIMPPYFLSLVFPG